MAHLTGILENCQKNNDYQRKAIPSLKDLLKTSLAISLRVTGKKKL